MTDRIEPALSAAEWEEALPDIERARAGELDAIILLDLLGEAGKAGAIAVLNAALLDSDKRKITRDKLDHLRESLPDPDEIRPSARYLLEWLDALESYLPPA